MELSRPNVSYAAVSNVSRYNSSVIRLKRDFLSYNECGALELWI